MGVTAQSHTTPMALTKTVVQGVEVELSLPHQSLSDTYIKLISEVLEDLPKITRLNLRDNRLTDVAVQRIVGAICSSMRGSVDIEVNTMKRRLIFVSPPPYW